MPRVSNAEISPPKELKVHWLSPFLEKIDEKLKFLTEILFRRLKILVLKLDNLVSRKLNKFKQEETKEGGLPLGGEPTEPVEEKINEEAKTNLEDTPKSV